jgi:hypothetical protein
MVVQGYTGQIVHKTLISKITRRNAVGSTAQAIEHPLCKCEAWVQTTFSSKTKKENRT